MRRGFLVGAVLFSSLMVVQLWGQVWVTNTGFASDRFIWNGVNYPVVTTPVLSLNTVSVSPAGASNATPGNVAGATNATLSISNLGLSSSANMVPPLIPVVSVSGQPTLLGHPSLVEPGPFLPLAAAALHRMGPHHGQRVMMARNAPQEQFLNLGAAEFDNAYSIPLAPENLAQAAATIRAWDQTHPAKKIYTNQDIDQIHQRDASRPETAIPAPRQ